MLHLPVIIMHLSFVWSPFSASQGNDWYLCGLLYAVSRVAHKQLCFEFSTVQMTASLAQKTTLSRWEVALLPGYKVQVDYVYLTSRSDQGAQGLVRVLP